VDTDHFKNINDLFGHLKGDEVLIALSRTLEACGRKDDLVFRWGGEEFVILLPRTSLETAMQIAESIRSAVSRITIPGLPRFTVSIGVARHTRARVLMTCLSVWMMRCIAPKMMDATRSLQHETGVSGKPRYNAHLE
jgi:diguanylate cyclase (GGDEF)-like protein